MPTFVAVAPVAADLSTQWGNAVMQSGGYTYIYGNYGNITSGSFDAMKVARVPLGRSLSTAQWQYWNGSTWVAGESNAVAVSTLNALTGVTPQQNGVGYMAVSVAPTIYANQIDLSYACSPQGPWTVPAPIYTVPQIAQYPDEIAYIPTFHPEISTPGSLIVSYNVDTTDGLAAIAQNVRSYQPQFLQLSDG